MKKKKIQVKGKLFLAYQFKLIYNLTFGAETMLDQ